MTGTEIRAAIASGMTPRELNERVQASFHKRLEAECAAGKWRCRLCGEPLKLMSDTGTTMFCDRHGGGKR